MVPVPLLPVCPRKCHLSILTLPLTWRKPRSGRGCEEANCLVSLGEEIMAGTELESHRVLFEQEDDFAHRLNNWRRGWWSWSLYWTSFGGLAGCLRLKLGSGAEAQAGGGKSSAWLLVSTQGGLPGTLPHTVKFR